MSWETYGLTAAVLFFVAWKIWDTTSSPSKRVSADPTGKEKKKLLFGRCLYEWRHFLTDFSKAALILVSLAIGINLASNIYEASGTVDILVKEVVVEKEVPRDVQKIVQKEVPVEVEKVVQKEVPVNVQKVVKEEVVKFIEVQRSLSKVLDEILKENPDLEHDRVAFVTLLEDLLQRHLGDLVPNADTNLYLEFPNGPQGQFWIGGDLKVKK